MGHKHKKREPLQSGIPLKSFIFGLKTLKNGLFRLLDGYAQGDGGADHGVIAHVLQWCVWLLFGTFSP